jgi:hypothetical protein
MSKPLRVRRLAPHEGQELQRIVRRGRGKAESSVIRWRRAVVVHASAGGNTVPVIAVLVSTSEDGTVALSVATRSERSKGLKASVPEATKGAVAHREYVRVDSAAGQS